jgi:hypothetical protein
MHCHRTIFVHANDSWVSGIIGYFGGNSRNFRKRTRYGILALDQNPKMEIKPGCFQQIERDYLNQIKFTKTPI